MHICYICNEYPKIAYPHGGVGTFVRTIAKELVSAGIKISVVGINYDNQDEVTDDSGVAVYRIAKRDVKGLSWLRNSLEVTKKIRQIHQINAIDIIETAELGLAFLPKVPGIKYVIRLHGGHHFFSAAEKRPVNWWKAFQEKRSFAKADSIVAVSSYVAETTRQLLHLGNAEIEVVYNPIDTSRFFVADKRLVRKHRVFFAGALIEKKGIRQLVQSLEYLIDEFPDIELVVAGRDANLPGSNTPYRPILESAISNRIRQHIKFLGAVSNSEIPQLIELAQVCCYPSHMEAMPLAWLEALAMGKVFIGSKTGPGPEVITDCENGLMADPYNPEDIADKIRYVFLNYDKAVEMGVEARKRVTENFDVRIIVQKNIEFYNSVK